MNFTTLFLLYVHTKALRTRKSMKLGLCISNVFVKVRERVCFRERVSWESVCTHVCEGGQKTPSQTSTPQPLLRTLLLPLSYTHCLSLQNANRWTLHNSAWPSVCMYKRASERESVCVWQLMCHIPAVKQSHVIHGWSGGVTKTVNGVNVSLCLCKYWMYAHKNWNKLWLKTLFCT